MTMPSPRILLLLLTVSFCLSAPDPVCNQIRSVAAKWAKDKSVTKVGAVNANEVLTWTSSSSPSGKYLVMNHAKIVVTGGVVTASADIILQNASSLQITPSSTLSYPQTSPGQYTLYTIDSAVVTFDHASLQTGGYIVAPTLCGSSSITLTELNLANSKESLSGYIAPFLRERTSLSLVGGKGSKHPLEISLNDQSSATVTNVSSSKIAVSAIVTFDDLVTSGVIDGLDPSKTVTKTYRFTTKSTGVDLTFALVQSQVFFGFWLLDGTNVQYKDSSIQLFPSLTASADVANVFTDHTYNDPLSIGPHVWVGMQNTYVLILNIYFHGPASHTLRNSIVGESSVSDKGKVTFTNVTVDGSGGYLSVVTNADLEYDGGAFDTFVVMSDKNSYARFLDTDMRTTKGHSHELLVGGGTLLLQDTDVTLSPKAYTPLPSGSGQIMRVNWDSSLSSPSPLPAHCGLPAYVMGASADVYTPSSVVTNWQLMLNGSVQNTGSFTSTTNGLYTFGTITFTKKGQNIVSLLLTPAKSSSPPANATLVFSASGSGCS